MISAMCRAAYLETYAAVFPYATKYHLLFPSNLDLYSLGRVKAKCHSFADRPLWQECPWWQSCPYYWVRRGWGRAGSPGKLWLPSFSAATYTGDPSNKSIMQLWTYFMSLAADETGIGFCPYVGTFPLMVKWDRTLLVDAVLEYLQCVISFSYFTLRPAM